MRVQLISGLVMAMAFGAAAHATELVQNGGFELLSSSAPTNQGFEYDPAFASTAGWVNNWTVVNAPGEAAYNILEATSTATTVQPLNRWNPPSNDDQRLWALPSNTASMNIGNHFMALDGDPGGNGVTGVQGPLQQTITGLTPGQLYTLTFDFAADQLMDRTGQTTEQLAVSLGSETHLTDILTAPSGGATPWEKETMSFTATSSSELLSFLSIGTPSGYPPIALLDNVSISVPEPATWALMLIGVGAVGASLRLRRRQVANLA
jgi:hypothetical protein